MASDIGFSTSTQYISFDGSYRHSDIKNISLFSLTSLGLILTTLSGVLLKYQFYGSAAIMYFIATSFDFIDDGIGYLGEFVGNIKKTISGILNQLSEPIFIGIFIVSQFISPVPGLIILVCLLLLSYLKVNMNTNWAEDRYKGSTYVSILINHKAIFYYY